MGIRIETLSDKQIKISAINFLINGSEKVPADILNSCSLEIEEYINDHGTAFRNIILRCPRRAYDNLIVEDNIIRECIVNSFDAVLDWYDELIVKAEIVDNLDVEYLNINKNVWMYVEKLYIHCYGSSDNFLEFLKLYEIKDYKNTVYPLNRGYNLPLYTFMHYNNYEFSDFMEEKVPFYKYKDILQDIIFDRSIIETKDNSWNYYGESIKKWYPKIVSYLKESNFKIDFDDEKLVYEGINKSSLEDSIQNFWDIIHNDIIIVAKDKFEAAHYEDAALASFKEVNIRVKTLYINKTGDETKDGRPLMFKAFDVDDPVIFLNDLSNTAEKDVQEGYKFIFGGAIQGIRNPLAHVHVKMDKETALHNIFLASLLMFKLDECK